MGTSSQKLIVLKELVGNQPPQLDPVQQFLAPHVQLINDFWVSVWILTAILLLIYVFREYLEHRKKNR